MKLKKYKAIGNSHSIKKSDIVYDAAGHDYGCAREDSLAFKEEFISVSYSPDGAKPFYTCELRLLQEVVDLPDNIEKAIEQYRYVCFQGGIFAERGIGSSNYYVAAEENLRAAIKKEIK